MEIILRRRGKEIVGNYGKHRVKLLFYDCPHSFVFGEDTSQCKNVPSSIRSVEFFDKEAKGMVSIVVFVERNGSISRRSSGEKSLYAEAAK